MNEEYQQIDWDSVRIIQMPKYKWKCQICWQTWFHTEEGPNWFHRFMQRLCFGVKWTRLTEEEQ